MSRRSVTLAEFGVQSRDAHVPMLAIETPKNLPKGSPVKFGNIVYRIAEGGGVGIVTSVSRYRGGFRYVVATPSRGTYEARISDNANSLLGVPEVHEIEILRSGNAFREKRSA